MSDRTTLRLGVIGATHHAESAITLLNGGPVALSQFGHGQLAEVLALAAVHARALVKAIEDTADENERQRQAEADARWSRLCRPPAPSNLRMMGVAANSDQKVGV